MALYIVYRNSDSVIVGTYRTDKTPPSPINKTVEQVQKADFVDATEKMQIAAQQNGTVRRIGGANVLDPQAPSLSLDCDNVIIKSGQIATITLKAENGPARLMVNGTRRNITDTFTLTIEYL